MPHKTEIIITNNGRLRGEWLFTGGTRKTDPDEYDIAIRIKVDGVESKFKIGCTKESDILECIIKLWNKINS